MENNFIGIYENSIPIDLCNQIIRFFDDLHKSGFTKNRQDFDLVEKTEKEDDALFYTEIMQIETYAITNVFLNNFWKNAYFNYSKKYSILNKLNEHKIYDLKVQKTQVGGGYHVWHCEQSTRESANRLLAFVAYLNDVDEGGETEFLYYPKRVSAKAGTVLLFPSAFTHTHRGNPPISNTKYIATGWVEF